MDRVLKMIWETNSGKNFTVNLKDPSTTKATAEAIGNWMNGAVIDNVFLVNGQGLNSVKDSYIYTTNKISLD